MAEYDHWAYSLMDSSRVSTFFISILLIVYGSFRSLNVEAEQREREKQKEQERCLLTGASPSAAGAASSKCDNNVQTLDSTQAMFLPVGASIALLVMFFFFDSMQMVFATCTAIIATVAFAFLLLPMCQYLIRPCSDGTKISFGCCGRFTGAEIVAFSLSFCLVCTWVLTGHWLLMDALGMGLCVAFIAFVRLPSLKVSTLLLIGLLIYDVFWVFFSSYIFNANVMVKVATRPAENPVGMMARKFHLGGMARDAPKLSLPGKLVFPSMHTGNFSMLGLGDIVMPGLLLCFVMRYDAYKRAQLAAAGVAAGCAQCCGLSTCGTKSSTSSSSASPVGEKSSAPAGGCGGGCGGGACPGTAPGLLPPQLSNLQKVTYFHCSLIGYFLGLLTATVSSEVFRAAQPALLYLVPFTLLPLLLMAYLKGDLRRMWHEPFIAPPTGAKYMDV